MNTIKSNIKSPSVKKNTNKVLEQLQNKIGIIKNKADITRADRIKLIDEIDNNIAFIYEQWTKNWLSDEKFAQLPKIKNKAYDIINIYNYSKESVSYNNLTNMNQHMLVKILNYNWFFNKTLKKDIREDLKSLPIISWKIWNS